MSSETINQESWIRAKWRPALGWAYVIICLFDFMIAPILWTYAQNEAEVSNEGTTAIVSQQWEPLTLGSGGFFHLAMGGILGVTAWGRTREKLNGVAGGGYVQSSFAPVANQQIYPQTALYTQPVSAYQPTTQQQSAYSAERTTETVEPKV